MKAILFNKDVVAIPPRIDTGIVHLEVDPFVTFATDYGLFIPISSSGYTFVRWINKGFPVLEKEDSIFGDLLHISNDGEMFVITADSDNGNIISKPVISGNVAYLSMKQSINEAYTYLFAKRRLNMAQAIKLLEDEAVDGFYNPTIISVSDWVEHARVKGLTKTFFRTRFSSKK